jgi:hypothetical protein
MRNASEVVREVGVDHITIAAEQQPSHLGNGLPGIPAGTVGILLWWKISFSR